MYRAYTGQNDPLAPPWVSDTNFFPHFLMGKNSTEYFVHRKLNHDNIEIRIAELQVVKILFPKLFNLGPLWVRGPNFQKA
jgi:hypothetical protein